jgi:hypothetical protein
MKQREVDIRRTPIDTIENALNDLRRQEDSLRRSLKVTEKLREGLEVAREKTMQSFQDANIRLLPATAAPENGTRNVGFLGAGLAARAAEVIEHNGSPMHIKDIYAQVSNMPGLYTLSIESLRATMNTDAKRPHPRLILMGQGRYGLAQVHAIPPTRRKMGRPRKDKLLAETNPEHNAA